MRPGSLAWFAQHELRLAWRDTVSMMTAGRRERERKVAAGFFVIAAFMHLVAFLTLGNTGKTGFDNDIPTFIAITAAVLLSGSAMLSQGMEAVTRTFYTRSDLELILSSPVPHRRLFAVRIGAIALSVSLMSVLLIGPFINVLAWEGGLRWLGAYGVIVAVSLIATALAVILTVTLFQTIGPKRTRLVAQIAAAVIGGLFVIGLQISAILSTGTMSRFALLQSDTVLTHVPGMDSVVWWPARAALGDGRFVVIVVAAAATLFIAVTLGYAPRFASFAIAASGIPRNSVPSTSRGFRVETGPSALRRKERLLLMRDPWLMSQSLMQLLYLLPPAVLLWHGSAIQGGASVILVPVLVMASGQLAGGLAWLTISGEDAPDLIATAPISKPRILRAKIETVLECIAIVFLPFIFALALLSPDHALATVFGIAASAMSAAAIQFWFRSQAKRSLFRRRHASSRIATFAEAFSSVAWAATAATTAAGGWIGLVVAVLPVLILGVAWALSPASERRTSVL